MAKLCGLYFDRLVHIPGANATSANRNFADCTVRELVADLLQIGFENALGLDVGVTDQISCLRHFATAFAFFIALACAFIVHCFTHNHILLKVAGLTWAVNDLRMGYLYPPRLIVNTCPAVVFPLHISSCAYCAARGSCEKPALSCTCTFLKRQAFFPDNQ